jgi:aminopeptidase N
LRSVLALVSLLVGAPLSAQQKHIDVVDYDLTVTLPDVGKTIDGVAVLSLKRLARGGSADTLALDLLDLTVKGVKVGGRDVQFTHARGVIRIPLGGAPDSTQVTVTYTGAVTDGLIITTDSAGRWLGFGDNWPNRGRHWIPSVDHPSDKATVTWTVIAPDDRKVVANGTRIEEALVNTKEDPDGHAGAPIKLRRTRWRESNPIPVYLMVIAAAPLVEFPLGNTACGLGPNRACVPQMVYTLPEQRRILPGDFREADSVVTFFSRTFGPYPYEKLAHLQSSTRFGGMENASAIFYSDRAFRTNGVSYGLLAHETAHQWFGDAVTEREWSHAWLSEGFATYLAALYTQKSRGDSAFRSEMRRTRETVLNAAVVANRPVIDTIETSLMALLNANSYQKGGWVLHMLREEIGDRAFFAGARAYQEKFRHGTALSDDLRAEMEAAAGRDLNAFFTQWLTRPGFPEVGVSWTYDDAKGLITMNVTQTGRFGLFAFPLTVEVAVEPKESFKWRVEVPARATSSFTFTWQPRRRPTKISADPGVQLLAKISER